MRRGEYELQFGRVIWQKRKVEKKKEKKRKEKCGSTDCKAPKGKERVITRIDERTVYERTHGDTLEPCEMQRRKVFAIGALSRFAAREWLPVTLRWQVRISRFSLFCVCWIFLVVFSPPHACYVTSIRINAIFFLLFLKILFE